MVDKSHEEIKKAFKEALQNAIETQSPITNDSIREIQQSRKYATEEEKLKFLKHD